METQQDRRCSETVDAGPSAVRGWHHRRPCPKDATVERDGKDYCGTHDPVAVKERRERRDKLRDAMERREHEQRLATRAKERVRAAYATEGPGMEVFIADLLGEVTARCSPSEAAEMGARWGAIRERLEAAKKGAYP